MYENQFLQFKSTIDAQECAMPMPVVFGGDGIAFFVPNAPTSKVVQYTITDAEGVPFTDGDGKQLSGSVQNPVENYCGRMFGDLATSNGVFTAEESRKFVAPDECFRIRVGVKTAQEKQWKSASYPHKDIASQAAAMERFCIFGNPGDVTMEVIEMPNKIAMETTPNPVADMYYKTTNDGKYYKCKANATLTSYTFVPCMDVAVDGTIIVTEQQSLLDMILLKDTYYRVLQYKTGATYHDFTLTGATLTSRINMNAARKVCEYAGVPCTIANIRRIMDIAGSVGFTLLHVTDVDYAVIARAYGMTDVRTYTLHTFEQSILAIMKSGERYMYNEDAYCYEYDGDYSYAYSNLLRRYENNDGLLSLIDYTCGTETFDLPFTNDKPIKMWLPIMVDNPTPEQKDEIYEKLNGERVVMYATINEKYECESDYIPYDWHKRIVIALSCDCVKINGTKLTKSESYDIDWDNYSKLDCGTKITKASWKMVANITSRNSNN